MKAIPISNPEKARINNNGSIPSIKYIIPLLIILYVKPAKMLRSIWPLKILAPNLSPSETFLDKYDINSINTSKGNNPSGQPAGTNNEKNFSLCTWNPKIVAPITTVKLIEKVNIKCDVGAKLYGTIPTKLFISIKINNDDINGKKICPLFALIWFITILYTVAYIASTDNDQLLGVVLS
jgi:hypothetical protein